MSKQNVANVSKRLWKIVEMIRLGKTRNEIIDETGLSYRNIVADITRIKKIGLQLKYYRSTGKYSIYWPKQIVPLNLTHEEFFFILYVIRKQEEKIPAYKEVSKKMKLAISEESDPIYNCTPTYDLKDKIESEIRTKLLSIKDAIFKRYKTVFNYKGVNKDASIRIVHPYKLIQTQISWYLVAYCEERKAFRNFKLTRMKDVKVMNDHYKPKNFDIEKHRGDAWWLQFDPTKINNPYKIKISFTNEAKEVIKEYNFHKTQIIQETSKATIVTWELSYLEEFASWLLQWLGNFEILECDELKNIIKNRIEKYG